MVRHWSFTATVAFSVLCIAALLMILVSVPEGMERRVWSAYDPVLIAAADDTPEVDRRLHELDPLTVSFRRATVQIQAFGAIEAVPVAELSRRLESVDPRMDPFVRELAGLFRTQDVHGVDYDFYFIPRHETVWAQRRRLAEALGATRFWLIGWDPLPRLVLLAAALVVGGVAAATVYRRRGLILFAALAAAAVAVADGAGGFVRAQVLFAAWVLILEQHAEWERERFSYGRERTIGSGVERWRLFFGVVAVAAVFLSTGFEWRSEGLDAFRYSALVVLYYLVFLVSATVLSSAACALRVRRFEHRLFAPVPILSKRAVGNGSLATGWIPPLLAVVLVVAPMAYFSLNERFAVPPGVVVPAPQRYAHLPPPRSEGYRPLALESYLAHRAYQQAMPFGRTFEVPQEMEQVTLRRFRWDGNTMSEWVEPVLVFDQPWFAEVLNNVPSGSVYDLWLREGPAQELVFQPVEPLYWLDQMRRLGGMAALVLVPTVFTRIERKKSRLESLGVS